MKGRITAVFLCAGLLLEASPPALAAARAVEALKLVASDARAFQQFGCSVTVAGRVVVVGACGDLASTGAAYVFERDVLSPSPTWLQVAKLRPDDVGVGDRFGTAVATDGKTIAIGINPTAWDAEGAVYIYDRFDDGTWVETARLAPADLEPGDRFGQDVAVGGGTIVIGAVGGDDLGNTSGSAYVFERLGGHTCCWVEMQKLLASDGKASSLFGNSVDVSGNSIIVGSEWDDHAGHVSGSAYVFERKRRGHPWFELAKLTASDAHPQQNFGSSVAVHGSTAIVGAKSDADGTAYVFSRMGGVWTQVAKLEPDAADSPRLFGTSVAIFRRRAVIGTQNSSGAHIWQPRGGTWRERLRLTASNGHLNDFFGAPVAQSGAALLVGAPSDDHAGSLSGAVYLYSRATD